MKFIYSSIIFMLSAAFTCAAEYQLIDLGPLGLFGNTRAVSNTGVVVADIWETDHLVPATLSQLNGRQNLVLPLNATGGRPNAINDSGVAVGVSFFPGVSTASRWTSTNSVSSLGTLFGGTNSEAYGINNAGQIAGISGITLNGPETSHAFLWDSVNLMQDLGDLPGGDDYSDARAINNNGMVVGSSSSALGYQAYKWTSQAGMLALDDLPGWIVSGTALGLNDLGQIIGSGAGPATGQTSAVLWDNSTSPTNLGQLPGGLGNSSALGINNLGQVVGYSELSVGGYRAFLWNDGTGMLDLNSLVDQTGSGWTLRYAYDVNELGQITGWGDTAQGRRAFLLNPLTPIPEPSTWAFIGALTIGLFCCKSRSCWFKEYLGSS